MNLKWLTVCCVLSVLLISSCDKNNEGFNPQGGQLPTNYISIRDTGIIPNLLIIANGNSVTFLNQTSTPKSIVSDDDVTIHSGAIPAGSSFFFKKDTTGVIDFHCVENPALRGSIIQTP